MPNKTFTFCYTKHQETIIKNYKCKEKAAFANKRFIDKISYHDILKLLNRYEFKCFYCDSSLHAKTWQLDHFYSKAMGGKNIFDNLVPSCKWCNQMKNALDGFSFLNRCEIIIKKNKIKQLFGDNSNNNFDYKPK